MKNLLKLAVENAATPQHVHFDGSGAVASIFLKGVISADFGIGANALRDAFTQAEGRPVNLYINSPGGDVFEGREMQGIVAAYAGAVTAIIQGVAASAATFVSMSAAKVQIVKGSRYMIHNGMTIALGDKQDMTDAYNLLSSFDSELAGEYAAKTGLETAQITQWMDAETWFTAEQALEHGFVDQINSNTQNTAMAQQWNLSAYANAPKQEALPLITAEHRARQLQRMSLVNHATRQ